MSKTESSSPREYCGIYLTKCLRELSELDFSKAWNVEVSNLPELLSRFLGKKTAPAIEKNCNLLGISFEEVSKLKKKSIQKKEKNLNEVIKRVKMNTIPPKLVPKCQAHNLKPKRGRGSRNSKAKNFVCTCKPKAKPPKKTALFKKCATQAKAMQYIRKK